MNEFTWIVTSIEVNIGIYDRNTQIWGGLLKNENTWCGIHYEPFSFTCETVVKITCEEKKLQILNNQMLISMRHNHKYARKIASARA